MGLDPNDKKPYKTYSVGMKKKLGLAQAFMEKSQLIILDEPFNGLDNKSLVHIRDFIKEYQEESNSTILISGHNINDIEYLCHQIINVEELNAVL